jgi:hypothetical protein
MIDPGLAIAPSSPHYGNCPGAVSPHHYTTSFSGDNRLMGRVFIGK